MTWAGNVAGIREIITTYNILVKISEEKRPLARPKY
jgi:hypothetical protein